MSHQHVFALSRKSDSILPFYTAAFDLATLNNDLAMAVCVFLCCAGTAIYSGLTEKTHFLNTSLNKRLECVSKPIPALKRTEITM